MADQRLQTFTLNFPDLLAEPQGTMAIEVYAAGVDPNGRQLFGVPDPSDVELIHHNFQVPFWRDVRSRDRMDPRMQQSAILAQERDYGRGAKKGLGDRLNAFANSAAQSGKPELSVLELGCADGATLRHLKKYAPDVSVDFFGLEMTDFLVDHLLFKNKDVRAIVGGADEFLKMGGPEFGADEFDIFIASGVLCQIPPGLARDVIRHAASFCDHVYMWDYLFNLNGDVSETDCVIFKLTETHEHILYLNPYERFLREAGFTNIDIVLSDGQNPEMPFQEGCLFASKP